MLFRLLTCIKRVAPRRFWQPFYEWYWRSFWEREEREEAARLGFSLQHSIRGSERAVLVERIAAHYPFKSLLDVGCGYGSNFEAFADLFPRSALVGIDRDEERVREGNLLLNKRGFENAFLLVADAREMKQFPENSFDIVVSSGFLLYVAAEHIEIVAKEMLRVSRGLILLLEQHEDSERGGTSSGRAVGRDEAASSHYWVRDYRKLFCSFETVENVDIIPVPNSRWQGESWAELGCLIEVRLSA